MMVPEHYEVNVARKEKRALEKEEHYYHFCRIEINEILPSIIEERWDVIIKAFPSPQYKCSLIRVKCHGETEKEN